MPREDRFYYTLVWCNLGRQFVPTEDGLYYSIAYVYSIKNVANPYLGKTGRTAS
jgi:hypothetical protein